MTAPDPDPRAELDLITAALRQARADRDRLFAEVVAGRGHIANLRAEVGMLRAELERRRLKPMLRAKARSLLPAARSAAAKPAAPSPDPSPDAPLRHNPEPPAVPPPPGAVLMDVGSLQDPARTGIARVVSRLAQEFAHDPGCVLVRAASGAIRYDTAFHTEVFGSPPDPKAKARHDWAVLGAPGTLLVSAAIQRDTELDTWATEVARLREQGVRYVQFVHDLLPLQLPDFFDNGMRERFPRWLDSVIELADVLLGDSGATIAALLARNPEVTRRTRPVRLGSDLRFDPVDPAPHRGREVLVVGTVEPRKAYEAVLDAMPRLWELDSGTRLTVVGRRGWADPMLIERLGTLSTHDPRVTWLEGATDDELAVRYAGADVLVAPSRGEGYGLPIAEARAAGLRVVARDIPVFRELLGNDGRYFRVDEQLAQVIVASLRDPKPAVDPGVSWADTAREVLIAARS